MGPEGAIYEAAIANSLLSIMDSAHRRKVSSVGLLQCGKHYDTMTCTASARSERLQVR
jgi:hypothetical protein